MTEISRFDAEIGAAATRVLSLEEDRELTGIKADDATRAVMAKIIGIEAKITPRRLREAVMTVAGRTWLGSVEAQIALARAKL